MGTFTTLLDIRNDIASSLHRIGLDNWSQRLVIGSEYNSMSRAIEAYLGVDKNTEHDLPETLEQMRTWYSASEGLAWLFNDAVREFHIPVTLIEDVTFVGSDNDDHIAA